MLMLFDFVVIIVNKTRMFNQYDITNEHTYTVRDIDDNGNVYFYNDRDELHLVTQADIDSGAVRMFSVTLKGRNTRQKFFAEEIKDIKECWK